MLEEKLCLSLLLRCVFTHETYIPREYHDTLIELRVPHLYLKYHVQYR
jgi:hypothetical protein